MKRFFIWVMLCCFGTLAAQTTLTFTGKDNLDHYVQLHRVVVENLTRNWTDTLYYPDTILMMSGVGLPDYVSASAFSVSQNVPNPFDGVTDFTMTLPYESDISIEVHDMSGRRVTGKEQRLQAGAHTFRVWLTVPQTYLLTVKTGHDAASVKMVNKGNASRNRIEYRNASPLTYELRATMGGEHPFESGDLMRYTGVMLYDNVALFSDTIEQPQYEDETFDLVFHLWGQIQDGGQFYSTQSLFIPDGTPCNGSCIGVVGIDVSGYPDGRIIESAEDIRYLRLKMEHSYLGDLWISLVCPNGQSAAVLKKNNNFSNDCTSSIPQGDWGWQTNDNSNVFFGQYYKPDVTGCDPAQNPMGICWNYCWSNNLSEGYQYACSNALVYESCNHIYATNPSPSGQSNSSYVDSTDVANMTNVYHPDISFAALTGCPMNGHWEIRFIDGFTSDNGYVENAELALAPDSTWHPISLPSVVTGFTSSISYTSAVCSGTVTSSGLSAVTARGFCWDTVPAPTVSGLHSEDGAGTGTFTSNIDNLVTGATYYYRAYATNAIGTAYGSQLTFSTIPNAIPEITTSTVTEITDFSALSGGTVTNNGGLPIIEQGVCWSTEQGPTTADSHIAAGSSDVGSFTCDLTSLTPGTTYYVRAYATNAMGTGYGNELTFTTFSAPTGITASYTYVTSTGADVSGNVTDNGGTPITARGFCWSVAPSPTILDDYVIVSGTSTGSFTSHITGLVPGTTYYLNAFAANSVDTSYSADVTFTTPATPLVTTSVVQGITSSTASVGGTVVHDGGFLVSDRGICWSTEPEPTLNGPFMSGGSGLGDFVCDLTDLESNRLYYARAYATNSVTTSYGETVSFTTNDSAFTCGVSTIRDYDDNIYHTVAIGSQCWMKENMRSTHLPDGTLIPLSSTASATEAARCYPNGNSANLAKYGYLYSWSAAMHGNPPIDGQGICPDGWHIPSKEEWQSLFSFVGSRPPYICGGSSDNYAKALAADHTWQSANGTCEIGNGIANNNATDFSMIPAGECEGSYSHFNTVAAFHSSYRQGNYSMVFAFYRDDRYVFNYSATMVNRMLSVRCLRDLPLNTPTLVAVTHALDSITTTSAVVPFTVSIYGTDSSIVCGVCWSSNPSPSIADNITSITASGNGSFSLPLTDLESNAIYYVRAFATNNSGTVYGQQRMFHTLDTTNASSANPILPIVRTTHLSNAFNGSTANCDGNVLFDGYSTVTERGICWDIASDPTVAGQHLASGSGTGVFSAKVNGLTPGMTYYLRAYATNSAGTAYGEELTLTVPMMPSVTTLPASNVGGTSAACFGSVISDGFGEILAIGICWDTLPNPTLSANFTTEGVTTGSFSSLLTGLTPNTTYHFRAYITSKVGTGYGNDVTFTTTAIPVITTAPISSINYTSAVSGGLDIQDNGDSITETGVCWSTQPQPDLDGQHLAVGNGTAAFSASLTGLTPGLHYHVRAYATNSHGTAYGQEVTFTARNDANPCPNDTTVTDFDGNVYHTVQIGEQCWLRENLRSTHYADGSYFSESYYANNDSTTLALYGRLYKWNVVMQGAESSDVPGAVQGICPDGWHLPAKVEYDTLIDYVIATYTSSQKALASTSGWSTAYSAYSPGYQQSTNNASGFSAYPTGTTLTNEGFGKSTAFWTATKHPNTYGVVCAHSLVIRNNSMQPYNSWFPLNDKLPVRCVKNN